MKYEYAMKQRVENGKQINVAKYIKKKNPTVCVSVFICNKRTHAMEQHLQATCNAERKQLGKYQIILIIF